MMRNVLNMVVVIVVSVCLRQALATDPPDGFTALYNGTSLDGWHGYNPHEIDGLSGAELEAKLQEMRADFTNHWSVENGELINDGFGPYACQDQDLGDMDLRLEFTVGWGGDSGIYLRGNPEVQLLDRFAEYDPAKPEYRPHFGSGGLIYNFPGTLGRDPLLAFDKVPHSWQEMRVVQIGSRVWVNLNDRWVVEGVEMENYWSPGQPLPSTGPILLQANGQLVRFRNIFVRSLDAAEGVAFEAENPPLPEPDFCDEQYGPDATQVLHLWKASSTEPTPVVVYYHDGGWWGGGRFQRRDLGLLQTFLDAGISYAAVSYRFSFEADREGFDPPISGINGDVARSLQYLRYNASTFNIDTNRIALYGGSSGACSALWLGLHDDMADPGSSDPVERESTRVACVGVGSAQTSLDPPQVLEWIPNGGVDPAVFGIEAEDELAAAEVLLRDRDTLLPEINEYSPYAQVSSDDPPVYLYYVYVPEMGVDQSDTAHSANFGQGLYDRCIELGVECEFRYPGATVEHPTFADFAIAKFNPDSGDPQSFDEFFSGDNTTVDLAAGWGSSPYRISDESGLASPLADATEDTIGTISHELGYDADIQYVSWSVNTSAVFEFTFNSPVDLSDIYVWNYSQNGLVNRGIGKYEIQIDTGSGFGTAIKSGSLVEATYEADAHVAQEIDLGTTVFGVAGVRIVAKNLGGNTIGVDEVAFRKGLEPAGYTTPASETNGVVRYLYPGGNIKADFYAAQNDLVNNHGGGTIMFTAGTYSYHWIEIEADIHVRFEPGVTIYLTGDNAKMLWFNIGADNASVEGAYGEEPKIYLPEQISVFGDIKCHAIGIGSNNFKIKNLKFYTRGSWGNIIGIGGDSEMSGGLIENVHSFADPQPLHPGWSVIQAAVCANLTVRNISADGGYTLRLEQDLGQIGTYGLRNIYAEDIVNYNGRGAVALVPNGGVLEGGNQNITVKRVRSYGSSWGLCVGDKTYEGDLGTYENSKVYDVTCRYGLNTQFRKYPELSYLPADQQALATDLVHYDSIAFMNGPSLGVVFNSMPWCTVSDVRAYGFPVSYGYEAFCLLDNNFDGDGSNDIGPGFETASINNPQNTDLMDASMGVVSFSAPTNSRPNVTLISTSPLDLVAHEGFTLTWNLEGIASDAFTISKNGLFLGVQNNKSDAWNNVTSLGVAIRSSAGVGDLDLVYSKAGSKGSESPLLASGAITDVSIMDGFSVLLTVADDNTWNVSTTGLSTNANASGTLGNVTYSELASSLFACTSFQLNKADALHSLAYGSVSVAPHAEKPAMPVMPVMPVILKFGMGAGGALSISGTNMNASAAYTLQGRADLLEGEWIDIATTSGVSQVDWSGITSTSNSMFYRVKLAQ
ncbi:family 16 glycoside hydrolase [Pontiella sulfatireligans]|uniref:Iota-carrageenase n=1 Tax=Pontiella sulfatireligans TaxID=2750658 RepID=A0A6C2UHL3_9BACT|nr:family 16 glycoside hydrolase [Pontiella sulfatireligans]VGO18844.1 Iota-carrageenase [Pontiella sulfatireligans]